MFGDKPALGSWSRGRRSQTVGADCLSVCHARDSRREGHKTRRCRRVTYPETHVTKYTTYTQNKSRFHGGTWHRASIEFRVQGVMNLKLGLRGDELKVQGSGVIMSKFRVHGVIKLKFGVQW